MNDIRYDGEIPLGEIHIIEETNRNFKLSSKVLEPEEMFSVLLASINKVYSDFLGYENNGLILSKEGQLVFDLLEKINKYKSIEEELGCDLDVFFKILKEKRYYFEIDGKVYYNENCYINNVSVNIGFISISVTNEELRNKHIFDVKLFFKDYKINWWLKENLEE